MIEHLVSPFTPTEVCEKLSNTISSVPRAASWVVLPQKPDGFYYGQVTSDSFYLTPASVHEKGSPLLEIAGVITPTETQITGSAIIIHYRPGRIKLLCWVCMIIVCTIWILLTILHFNKIGVLNTAAVLPIFGLAALSAFTLAYRKQIHESRFFLKSILLLQKKPSSD